MLQQPRSPSSMKERCQTDLRLAHKLQNWRCIWSKAAFF